MQSYKFLRKEVSPKVIFCIFAPEFKIIAYEINENSRAGPDDADGW
jgi:hypothetical protein